MSRAAVSSWFLDLETGGRAVSGRTFRYNRQSLDVQAKIAQMLGDPVESLRLLSTGAAETGASFQAFAAPDFSPTIAPELWTAVQEVLSTVAVRGMNPTLAPSERIGDSLRHRIAAVAESVEDVVATLVVTDHRGHGVRRTLFHHLVTVFVRQAANDVDLPKYLASQRKTVSEALGRAALPNTWEPPWREPNVAIDLRDEPVVKLGTLVAPWLSAPWPPHKNALVPTTGDGQVDALAVIVGGPSSDAELAGGLLADTLGVGFIRDVDLVKRAGDVRVRRNGTEISYFAMSQDWSTAADYSFVIEHGLHLLRDGRVPGAWLFGMQAHAIDDSPSLKRALIRMPELLLVIFTTSHWRHLAAWRLAGQQRATTGQPGSEPDVLEFVTEGEITTDQQRQTLATLTLEAKNWLARLNAAQATLERLVDERRKDPSRHTITSDLDAPSNIIWLRVEDGVWRQHTGPTDETDNVVFPGYVDDFADSQIDVTVELFIQLAERAGHTTNLQLTKLLKLLPSSSLTRRSDELFRKSGSK